MIKPRTYVYFIRECIGDLAPVKIGIADDIDKRMQELQIGNSRRLVLAAKLGPFTRARAFDIEMKMHSKFHKHRIRGEWFTGVVLKQMYRIQEDVVDVDIPNEKYLPTSVKVSSLGVKIGNQ